MRGAPPKLGGTVIFLLLSRLLCALPLSWALVLGRFLGWLWYYVIPIRRRVALDNVRRALGTTLSPREQKRIVRHCITHLVLCAVESFRLPKLTRELSEQLVEMQGTEHLEAALAEGKGVIVFLAHLGNVELGGCSQAVRGFPVAAVTKAIHWGPAQSFAAAVRARTGVHLIPPKKAKHIIREALTSNEVLCLLVDQHVAPHRAIVCELFGQLVATSPAVARFAFETGAPVLPAVNLRKGLSGRHLLRIEPRLELETPHDDLQANIRHNTERINRHVEGWIRRYPEQWLWLHKRWKVQHDPRGWDIPPHLRHLVCANRIGNANNRG